MNAATPPMRWDAETLWERLVPLLSGLTIEIVGSTDSTNSWLVERARKAAGPRQHVRAHRGGGASPPSEAGVPVQAYGRRDADTAPCLLVAESQTQGRGRMGRSWTSQRGRSLTFSLALSLRPRDWSGLSLAVGVALADALDPVSADSPRIGLKWPNDLWLMDADGGGRKLGGVLVETVAVNDQRMVVVGVGLNVKPLEGAPAGKAQTTTAAGYASGLASLEELDAGLTPPRALHGVAEPLVRALLRFEREGWAPFAEAYRRRDLLLGRWVTLENHAADLGAAPVEVGPSAGEVMGIGPDGALRVRDGLGQEHAVHSGEVRLSLASRPSPGPAGA